MKSNKKAFTIVELVIVIAVIAILAAVLIPTFSNLIKRSKVSADQQLIRNLNTALAADLKDHPTMTIALKAAEEFGYDVGKINASATDNEILWDSVNDAFCYYDADAKEVKYIPETTLKSGAAPDKASNAYWCIITDKNAAKAFTGDSTITLASPVSGMNWSCYLTAVKSGVTEITTSTGVDVGTTTQLEVINYVNTTSSANTVVIRTNGGSLTVNAENDKVIHYGVANKVDIQAVAPTSYVENGIVSIAKIKTGRIVVTQEAVLTSIHVVETNGNYDNIKVAVVGSAELPSFTRDEVTMNDGDKKLVIEVQSIATIAAVDESPEYIWISKIGENTSTDVATSGTTLNEETKIPAASQTSTAKSVATDAVEGTTAEQLAEMEAVATRYAGGQGTESNPYLLATKAHFGSIDEDIHDGLTAGKYYRMVADINLGEMLPLGWMTLSGKASDQGYTITGNESFNGNFDGNNHILKYKMTIDSNYTASTVGLFGSIQDCTISNLTIDADLNCTKGTTWVGAIAGFGMSSNLKNVTVNGSVYGKHDVGGFFGYYGNDSNNNNNIIENCINNAAVTNECDRSPNYSPTGGFVGQLSFNNVDYTLTFKNCINNATIKTTNGGYSATSHFVGFVSDNAASGGYDVRIYFVNCSVGQEASVSSTISVIRNVSNKSVYCCATENAISVCAAIEYVGITSNLCSATASPTKVYINDALQDMSLYFVQ